MKYIIKSDLLKGEVSLLFHNGFLKSIEINLQTPLNQQQVEQFLPTIPYLEEEVTAPAFRYLKLEKVPDLSSNIKIAMFCEAYSRYCKGVKYKATASEVGKIRHYEVTEKLLTTYFTSNNFLFKGKYCISNYVKYFNNLKVESENVNPHGFPNAWNRDYFDRLDIRLHNQYYEHLRSLGYKPKMRDRQIIDWT